MLGGNRASFNDIEDKNNNNPELSERFSAIQLKIM